MSYYECLVDVSEKVISDGMLYISLIGIRDSSSGPESQEWNIKINAISDS